MRPRASASTPTMQFAEAFENQGGLGSKHTIRDRLSVLATKGFVKFLRGCHRRSASRSTRSQSGYLCVEGMDLRTAGGDG